jgi:hypothetical protein
MATDYGRRQEAEAARDAANAFAERRGIVVSQRIAEMARNLLPEKLREGAGPICAAQGAGWSQRRPDRAHHAG